MEKVLSADKAIHWTLDQLCGKRNLLIQVSVHYDRTFQAINVHILGDLRPARQLARRNDDIFVGESLQPETRDNAGKLHLKF